MDKIIETHNSRLIIVAYRLPYKFIKKNNKIKAVQNSGGLVSAMLSLSTKISGDNQSDEKKKIIWAGKSDTHLQNNQLTTCGDFELFPIDIPERVDDKFYGGFCNDMVWPLFHYFPDAAKFDMTHFNAYLEANRIVSENLRKIIKPGDFIWIHDYHFFMLPALIRNWAPMVSIGFFLHIPFPSHEIFRLMPRTWKEELLKGILGADLVGFHTNDYTRHFINSVKHTLGYDCVNNVIRTDNHSIKADAFPIGIDFEKFNNASSLPAVVREKEKLNKSLRNLKLIFSVDRLDYSKGLLNRLHAFEIFLEKYPFWRGIIVFNMVVVPSRDSIDRYKAMKKEIEATVGRINGKYSTLNWRPIIYQYKSLHFHEMVALYEISDIGFITPLRDGMNLVSKEYIACQHVKKGVLILSEMAGAADELKEAIIINPNDRQETADALNKALLLKEKEKCIRIDKMQQRIKNYDVFTWSGDFFSQLNDLKKEQEVISAKLLTELSTRDIASKYFTADKRLLLLDYDGSLVPFNKDPEKAAISKKTYFLIQQLANDPKNNIYIISGRSKNFLEKHLKNLMVNLIAEHGFYTKETGNKWTINANVHLSWKNEIFSLLMKYVKRCSGSQIEEKHSSIAWHYRNADQDNAKIRLIEIKKELDIFFKKESDLMLLDGNKVIEIKSTKYNKGSEVKKIISDQMYDFIFAIGDDRTDEHIFEVLPESAYSIKIGLEPTSAKYYLNDQTQVIEFLTNFILNK